MGFQLDHDIGSEIAVLRAAANTSLTAAGSGDNTEIVGAILDRSLLNYPLSAVFAMPFTTTLAVSKKLTYKTVKIEHGDDSGLSDAANFSTPADVDVATDSGSGSTLTGCQEYSVDLAGAKRYVRLKFTPDLNASGTDTAAVSAVCVFGPGAVLPE